MQSSFSSVQLYGPDSCLWIRRLGMLYPDKLIESTEPFINSVHHVKYHFSYEIIIFIFTFYIYDYHAYSKFNEHCVTF